MSQNTKRDAEAALIDQQSDRQSKRQRRKNRKSAVIGEARTNGSPTLDGDSSAENREQRPAAELIDAVSNKASARIKDQPEIQAKPPASKGNADASSSSTPGILIPVESGAEADRQSLPNKRKQKKVKGGDFRMHDLVAADNAITTKDVVWRHKHKKSKKSNADEVNGWTLSSPAGGTFLNMDPILTSSNEYMILLTKHGVQVYSTRTSLLVRSIAADGAADFRTCTLSASDPQHLFVGTRKGHLVQFDWTTGRKISQWKIKPSFQRLFSVGRVHCRDTFLTVAINKNGDDSLSLLSVDTKDSQFQSEIILQAGALQENVCFSPDASIIVACGRDRIYVGRYLGTGDPNISERQYSWKHLQSRGSIVTFDARFSATSSQGKKGFQVDVVAGLQNGSLMVYNDLASKLHDDKSSAVHNREITGRKFHWHRTSAQAVKWSRDGNYLISGGDETVLVIWQLDTNQRQYLPHLSTSILNITVSLSGAHYGLRLGDNSVMVLSTADLLPSTNVTGLLGSGNRLVRGQTLLHPTEPNKLLSAVSARTLGSRATGELTHLQVYDIDAKIQLSRQALTRNFTTAVNIGPAGETLREPTIIQMCITSDGKWLATIDEWSPNTTDLEPMYLDEEAKIASKEITLRIWARAGGDDGWISNTCIDEPCPADSSVIAMVANPAKPEFATLADDGMLKIWTPKARMRNGLAVKDQNEDVLYTWSCSYSIHIQSIAGKSTLSSTEAATAPSVGALSYSQDGSVLAAYRSQGQTPGAVHLLDPHSGAIVISQVGLVGKGPVQLRFSGRFLISLSDKLTLFDIILLQLTSSIALDSKSLEEQNERRNHLAIDSLSDTIAVGTSSSEPQLYQSQIRTFAIDNSSLIRKAKITFHGQLRALVADRPGNGFVVVDADASIRRFTPTGQGSARSYDLIRRPDAESQALTTQKGVNDMFDMRRETVQASNEPAQRLLENGNAARASMLDELFSGSFNATTSVQDLFERVAKAVSVVPVEG